MLTVNDFAEFFKEVHGVDPFPWQTRLLEKVAQDGEWPVTLDLPTGSGKTAAIDIAVFHLALQADGGVERKAPVRIAFVVDRRLVVDDAFGRAQKITDALDWSLLTDGDAENLKKKFQDETQHERTETLDRIRQGRVVRSVAAKLKSLSGDGPPLITRRLRGGIPREDDWARTPSQPTVLCSTVDQVGSRLLFRGYGVSDSMKPVHAGLVGSDCLILLDEAHLAEPFRQTLEWAQLYRSDKWRQSTYAAPFSVALLTATPGAAAADPFALEQDDKAHPVLKKRLDASKPVNLIKVDDDDARQQTFIAKIRQVLDGNTKAIGVVVNRVARARALFEKLRAELSEEEVELMLLIGPARPAQRDQIAELLDPIRTGADKDRAALEKPLVIIATQTIEAGVDIDLDALFTEVAPLDALLQRFGRLNRNGRDITPSAVIVAVNEEVGARSSDPVYGEAITHAWKVLDSNATTTGKGKNKQKVVDFGLNNFPVVPLPLEALSPKPDAPVLMPAHLDLLSQTSPVPAADPEVALYLHGPSRQPDGVTVIWRADINPDWEDQDVLRLLTLVPPRSGEAIELPVWAVRHWLSKDWQASDELADVPSMAPEMPERNGKGRLVFRWKGLDERSQWISSDKLRVGDTIIVPASYGGVDEYGWCPQFSLPAADIADDAAAAYRGRRFGFRVAPGLLGDGVAPDALSGALASVRGERWEAVRDAVLRLALPDALKAQIRLLALARGKRGRPAVELHFDVYGVNADDEPRGLVFVASHGLENQANEEQGRPNTTEDDVSGSLPGFMQSLAQHSADVQARAEAFASSAGLPADRIADLKLAGFLHDEGKRDPRFQRWLHHGDPLGADPDDENTVLAKSARPLPPNAREKAGLPARWRHEALSVRLARAHERLKDARDKDLVLWLVGTHHGHGRPLFPHADPKESTPNVGPQSLAFDWNGLDWPTLFQALKKRYGVWELARMEAILRLADHRASEDAAKGREAE
ncbi:MAG: type I-U CRISPR-associated helicase/endonuclease Cas3 [Azoarcus sp.]|jgi:CRISPR-associated endonuclease/helicase Cas3|nr:type I-U CRISPR-associated helicase/endonuclease Cas3 [Azoarcus sp.]